MKIYILLVILALSATLFYSCDEGQTTVKEVISNDEIDITTEGVETATNLAATLGADAAGAYAGAKVGGWLGLALGPVASAVGAVAGAAIAGSVASYKAAKAVTKKSVLVETEPPYDGEGSGLDSIGYIHNQLVRSNWTATNVWENDSINRENYYNKSITLLKSRGHNDSIDIFFTLSDFYALTDDYNLLNLSSESDILSTIDSVSNTSIANNHLKNMITNIFDMDSTNTHDDVRNIINSAYNGIDNLLITNSEKDDLKYAIKTSKYSFELWIKNIN